MKCSSVCRVSHIFSLSYETTRKIFIVHECFIANKFFYGDFKEILSPSSIWNRVVMETALGALQQMGHFTLDEFKVLEYVSHTSLSESTLLTVQCKHFHPMIFIMDSGGQDNVFSNVTWNLFNLATLTIAHPTDILQTTFLEPQPRVPFLPSCNWSVLISRTYLFWGASKNFINQYGLIIWKLILPSPFIYIPRSQNASWVSTNLHLFSHKFWCFFRLN